MKESTKILGLDFTSAPKPSKPITAASAVLAGGDLCIDSARPLKSFKDFEEQLAAPGPWVAGIDLPFGQPRRLICALGWPQSWPAYVRHVEKMEKDEFVCEIRAYQEKRLKGHKEHKRITDECAKSLSPMKLYGQPVGKMFFEGAPRILRSGASIVPCAPNDGDRVIVEAYPALVAIAMAGTKSYKNDKPANQTPEHKDARRRIVDGLLGARCRETYGIVLRLDAKAPTPRDLIDDPTGDRLDAVLCVLQAAWSSTQCNYGVPESCDALEGWIVDPSQLRDPVPERTFGTERITTDSSICHGKPCIRGLRYPVDMILELLSSGMSVDEILADYADLERADILAVFDYAARLSRVKRMQAMSA